MPYLARRTPPSFWPGLLISRYYLHATCLCCARLYAHLPAVRARNAALDTVTLPPSPFCRSYPRAVCDGSPPPFLTHLFHSPFLIPVCPLPFYLCRPSCITLTHTVHCHEKPTTLMRHLHFLLLPSNFVPFRATAVNLLIGRLRNPVNLHIHTNVKTAAIHSDSSYCTYAPAYTTLACPLAACLAITCHCISTVLHTTLLLVTGFLFYTCTLHNFLLFVGLFEHTFSCTSVQYLVLLIWRFCIHCPDSTPAASFPFSLDLPSTVPWEHLL